MWTNIPKSFLGKVYYFGMGIPVLLVLAPYWLIKGKLEDRFDGKKRRRG